MISYVSTRGGAPELAFGDALLTGLATDGGLYCPAEVPTFDTMAELAALPADAPYDEVAFAVMWPFVEGSIERDVFRAMVTDAYAGFRDPAVCPLVDLGDDQHLLDLTKGPTLAFKDIALQLVGRLFDDELGRRDAQVTVLAATSGDTGSAAIEALKGCRNVRAVVLHPRGRVSDVQRRQMTTVDAANIRNVAIEGTFDDCQDLVKAAFNDEALRHEFGLGAVNSINWARVMAQIVYYVTAARTLAPDGGPLSFTVPTGNFGNILAGWYAKRMGLPVDQLIVASNRNDVLTRYFDTGALSAEPVVPSFSPSMDIQVSSNFERLLWESSGRDGHAVARLLSAFRSTGNVVVPEAWTASIRADFDAGMLDDAGTLAEIRRVDERVGRLIDPHTAVGTEVARRLRRNPAVPMVVLETADPAKFPDAVEKATGRRPSLPPFLSELMERTEHYVEAPNDLGAVVEQMRSFGP